MMEDLVLRYLREERKDHDHKPGWCDTGGHTRTQKWWYPSQLGGCDRANLLAHLESIPRTLSDDSLLNFWYGSMIDGEMKKIGRKQLKAIGTYQDLSVRDAVYKVSGRPDLVYRDDKGVLAVKEFKSVKPGDFARKESQGPSPHHIIQLKVYLTFAPVCPGCGEKLEVPSYGDIVYVNKAPMQGEGKFLEYRYYASPEVTAEVTSHLARMEWFYQQFLKDGSYPEALADVQQKDKDGTLLFYERSGKTKGGRVYTKGQPKMESDWRMSWCDFKSSGFCCADGDVYEDTVNDEIGNSGSGMAGQESPTQEGDNSETPGEDRKDRVVSSEQGIPGHSPALQIQVDEGPLPKKASLDTLA